MSGSVLVEHPLDVVGLGGQGESQLQQDARLLRVQIVGGDETRFLPIVVAHHPARADAGAAHHHDAGCVVKLLQGLARILGMTGAGARNDQALGAGGDRGLGEITIIAGVAVEDVDLGEFCNLRQVELRLCGVPARGCAVEDDPVRIGVAEV